MLRGIVRHRSLLGRFRVAAAAAASSATSIGRAAPRSIAPIDAREQPQWGWGFAPGRRWMSAPAQDGISEEEARDRVMMIVKAHPKVNPAKLTTSSHFINDLGLDSLDVVEIVMGFEEEFVLYIPDEDADKLISVPAAVDFVAKHPMAK